MRLGILAIALSMAVLTIAAPDVRTQEAANVQGTSDSSSCPQYKKFPLIYPKCGNYATKDIEILFRMTIESTLWDRLVNMGYAFNVFDTLLKATELSSKKLKNLTPFLWLGEDSLPSGGTWIKRWDASTPITDLIQDGKFINILLIDEFDDAESRYKCHTTQEGNTIVQSVGPLFYAFDDGLILENNTERNRIKWDLLNKITRKIGIQKWTSTKERLDDNLDLCKGYMETGNEDDDFSKCSSKEFERYLDSDGGHSLISLVRPWQYPITLTFRMFVNDKLTNQLQKHKLVSTIKTVQELLRKTLFRGPLRPQLVVRVCEAEGITVLPWPDAIEGSAMTELDEEIKKTIDSTSIKTKLNLVMLDKPTFDSISKDLPGHRKPITCDNTNDISARTLIMWTEPGDKMIQDKVNELVVTIATKLGIKDNRQSSKVIKDSDGRPCDGIMEGGGTKFSKCSKEDFAKYMDSDKGLCLSVKPNNEWHVCAERPTSCERCANGWIG